MTQQARFRIRSRHQVLHLNLVGNHGEVQFLQDVFYSLDELGALLNEVIGAPALGREDAAGDGEDFAVLVGGPTRGDDRATLEVAFDHKNAGGHAGQNAVAARKIVSAWLRAERVLADESAVLDDVLCEFGMLRRIDDVETAGEDRNSSPARLDSRVVDDRVDAAGKAANHADLVGGARIRSLIRDLTAVLRWPACTSE